MNQSVDSGNGYDRLADRTALVTDSTRGLGIVIAERLARDGANIIVSGREQDDIDRAYPHRRRPQGIVAASIYLRGLHISQVFISEMREAKSRVVAGKSNYLFISDSKCTTRILPCPPPNLNRRFKLPFSGNLIESESNPRGVGYGELRDDTR